MTNRSGKKVKASLLYDKRLKGAYLYTLETIKKLIETSPDGKIINSESRKKAKEKTIKLFR